MKRMFYSVLAFSLFLFAFSSIFAEENSQRESSFSITLSQDPTLGFYPSIAGSIPIGEKTDFTFYGIYWTQDALAGKQGGFDLLTEFGFGLNFLMLDGAAYLNPNIGFGHGNYQSGGGRAVVGDNIVASIYAGYSFDNFNIIPGIMYYKNLRNEGKNTPLYHLFEYFLKFNYSVSRYVTAGIFFDHYLWGEDYSNINPNKDKIKFNTFYFVFGPEVSLKFKDNASVTFSLGPNLVDHLNKADNKKVRDYYKLSTTVGF